VRSLWTCLCGANDLAPRARCPSCGRTRAASRRAKRDARPHRSAREDLAALRARHDAQLAAVRRGRPRAEQPPLASPTLAALRDALLASGRSTADVARSLGWSPSRLHHYLSGARAPGIVEVEAMARALGVELAIRPLPRRPP
jgi:ribosome-binding protein aMBF1 (putative translation factor)